MRLYAGFSSASSRSDFIGCVMCYLMSVQNLYLRSPHASVFALLTPDAVAYSTASALPARLDAIAGFLFADSAAKGTRNLYVWIFGFFIFAVFVGGFMLFLKQSANAGTALVAAEIARNKLARLGPLTDPNEEAVLARIRTIRVWPLARPTLEASLAIAAALVASFIFYKIGALVILTFCLTLPALLWRSDQAASER